MGTNFHPGQFPVGSPSSRAAARSLIDERRSHAKLVDMVGIREGLKAPVFGAWKENENGSFTRCSQIPAGMTFGEAELVAGVAPVKAKGEYMRLMVDL